MRALTAPIFYAIYPFKLAADAHPCLGLILVLMRLIPIRVLLGMLGGFRALKEALGAPISDGGCLEEDEND